MVGRICKWAYKQMVKRISERVGLIPKWVNTPGFTIFSIMTMAMIKTVISEVPGIFWNTIS